MFKKFTMIAITMTLYRVFHKLGNDASNKDLLDFSREIGCVPLTKSVDSSNPYLVVYAHLGDDIIDSDEIIRHPNVASIQDYE